MQSNSTRNAYHPCLTASVLDCIVLVPFEHVSLQAVKQSMHRCTLDVSVEFPRTKGETGKSTVLGQTYTFTRRASAVLTSAVEKVGTKL